MTDIEVLALMAIRTHHQLAPIELARVLWPTAQVWPKEAGMAGAAGKVLHRLGKAGLVENPQQLALIKGYPPSKFWVLTLAGIEWLASLRATQAFGTG